MTEQRLVIIGGGPAGLEAARAFREAGGTGEIILISADEHAPYNRPPLSKDFLRGDSEEDSLPLEADEFYADHAIELRLGASATVLDTTARTLIVSGAALRYGACILATGAVPKPLAVRGADGAGVRYLRSRCDARELRQAAASARSAVIVGSGFIGCEAAASLAGRGLAVTLVSAEKQPQAGRLGPAAGERIREWLVDAGVVLRLGVEVGGIEDGGRVRLADGTSAEGDFVLVAGGAAPASTLARNAGLTMARDRVQVDAQMRTSRPDVLAAGDVACAFNAAAGRHLSVEHWGEALAMGRVAGETAAGRDASWAEVPGFWSTIGERTLKYAAWGDGFDETRLVDHGDGAFTVWYGHHGATVGVLTHEADQDFERGRRLIEDRQPVPRPARPASGRSGPASP